MSRKRVGSLTSLAETSCGLIMLIIVMMMMMFIHVRMKLRQQFVTTFIAIFSTVLM